MRRIAFLFPGQASQKPGMGVEFYRELEESRDIFERSDRALGHSLSSLCFEGPQEELTLTEHAQPGILTTSVAIFTALENHGLRPDFVAGHSLGEYSALVASGSLALEDAVRLVRNRGRYMQEAVPLGAGAMAAIVGLSIEIVEEICGACQGEELVVPANLNAPDQTVISGHRRAVERAMEAALEQGARRAVPLQVSAPFHCPLMEPAKQRLSIDIDRTPFDDLRFPLVANSSASLIRSGKEAREALIHQMTAPVRWVESMSELRDNDVNAFIEVGPGRVLAGLLRKIDRQIPVFSVNNLDTLSTCLAEFGMRA